MIRVVSITWCRIRFYGYSVACGLTGWFSSEHSSAVGGTKARTKGIPAAI